MRIKVLAIFLVVISCVTAGCVPKDSAERHLSHALDFVELQMLKEADIEVRNALRIKENDKRYNEQAEGFLLRSISYVFEGENKKAIRELEAGLKKHESYWNVYPLLASLYMREGEYDKAIVLLRKMPNRDFGDTQLKIAEGLEYSKKDFNGQALKYYESAKEEFSGQSLQFNEDSGMLKVVRNGTFSILYDLLATAYEKTNELSKALENYENLEKISPQFPQIMQKIAIVKYKIELKNNPKNAAVLNSLGWQYYQIGEREKAAIAYKTAIKNDHSLSIAFNNLGLVHYDRDEFNEAASSFNRAITLNNDNSAKMYALYNLGRIFRRKKEYQKAVNCFEQAMKINPSYGPALKEFNIAMLLLMIRSDSKSVTLGELGDAYYNNQELAPAIKIYEEIAKKRTANFQVYFNLGQIYFTKQIYDRAQKNYQKVILIKPANWQAHKALANLHYVKKEYKKALVEIEKALSDSPGSSVFDIKNQKAYIYFEMGQNKDAIAVWKEILNDAEGQCANKIKKIIKVLES
ncbi:MAG: tetratricopeptide repeat protein [Candidatus Margulisiibacteriota bacterium]